MESGMIVIAAVLFVAVLVPTLLIFQNTKKESKTIFNSLKAIVTQNNGVLTEHTQQSNFALGIDNSNKTIYFFKKTEDGETSQVIDLSQVTTCEIATIKRRLKKEKGFEELVEKISLVFISKNNSETKQIELYNEEDTLLTDEVSLAENWKKIIQGILPKKNRVTEQNNEQQLSSSLA